MRSTTEIQEWIVAAEAEGLLRNRLDRANRLGLLVGAAAHRAVGALSKLTSERGTPWIRKETLIPLAYSAASALS